VGVVLLSSLQLHARLRCSSRPHLTRRPVPPQDKTSPSSEWKDPQDILSSPQVVSIYPPLFSPVFTTYVTKNTNSPTTSQYTRNP
jgi:hypothetical protein